MGKSRAITLSAYFNLHNSSSSLFKSNILDLGLQQISDIYFLLHLNITFLELCVTEERRGSR